MSEGNRQKDNESRLDRLEDAYNLMIQDHEDFRREHKALLAGQVVMQDSLTRLSVKVEEIGDKLNGLIVYSEEARRENEQTRRENEVRFRRLEEKH
jgi:hypothetical protein